MVASDGLNENATTVIIHINDVNDMLPEFSQPLYQAVMAEELAGPYPYKLLKVKYDIRHFIINRSSLKVQISSNTTNHILVYQ